MNVRLVCTFEILKNGESFVPTQQQSDSII